MESARDAAMLAQMIKVAAVVHESQFDKRGRPYFLHVSEVASKSTCEIIGDLRTMRELTYEEMAVAYGHDLVEDTWVSVEYLREMFRDRIADAIDGLTHRPDEDNETYWRRCKQNILSLRIKLIDVSCNITGLRFISDDETRDRLRKKYSRALMVLQHTDEEIAEIELRRSSYAPPRRDSVV
jgi:(p)ppGpp synthase/HD superfamily hydrolase